MHVLISESSKRLSDEEWKDYMSCKVESITSERRLCREGSAITTAVRNADGIAGTLPVDRGAISKDSLAVSNRHYIPYSRIRATFLMQFLHIEGFHQGDPLMLRAAGQRLEWAIQQLYFVSPGTAFSPQRSFRPPLCNLCQHDRALDKCEHWQWSSVERSRTRAHASNWMTWALEIICDFPDNIYHGHGTGAKEAYPWTYLPAYISANRMYTPRNQWDSVHMTSPFTWSTDLEGRPRRISVRDELTDGRIFIDTIMQCADNGYPFPPTKNHMQPFLHYFSCERHGSARSSDGLEAFYAQWKQMESFVEHHWSRPLTTEESRLLAIQLRWFEEIYDHTLAAGPDVEKEAWNVWQWYSLQVEEFELSGLTDRRALENFIDENTK